MFTLFPTRCYNGGQQHRFQAQITEDHVPTNMPYGEISGHVALVLASRESVTQTYHGAVCCWCGKVVNKQETKS